MKRKTIPLILLVLPALLQAQQPNADQLMSRSFDLTRTESLNATVNLTIKEKNGSTRSRTISMSSASFGGGVEKRLIRFIDPPDVRGTSMLVYDNKDTPDEMWIYLPAHRKTRRIVSAEKGKSFMSSEFSNSDMTSPTLSDFRNKFAENSGDAGSYIIESIPVNDDKAHEYGFSKKITWLNKATMQVEKMLFYNFDNQLFKVIEVKKTRNSDKGRYLITDMLAVNKLTDRESEIFFSDIKEGIKSDPAQFTLQNMER
jgi:hypothetical protein